MSEKRWVVTLGAFVSMSFIGMSRTFLGTALPAIRSSLELTLIQAGTLTAFLQLGFTLAVFVGGPLSDVLKKSFLLLSGCLLMGLNLVLFGFSDWFWISLVGAGLIGIGGGLIESSSNPLLIQLFPGKESTVMNLHHFFFAAGSLAGPLIMGAVLVNSIPWRWGYMGFGLFVFLIFLFLTTQRISSPKYDKRRSNMEMIKRLFKEKKFLVLFFITFFGSGVQNGIGYWMVTFLEEIRSVPIAMASVSLSLFFTCLAVGRLFSSWLITKLHEVVYLLGLMSILFIALLIAVLTPSEWAIAFFGLCGFSLSGVFPCLLGMVGKLYSKSPGTAMGMIATGAGLGSIVVPWLMSLVSQEVNLLTGFLFFEVFVITCLILMAINFKGLKLAGRENPF